MTEYYKKPMNVFLVGKVVPTKYYLVDRLTGVVTFTKPLPEIAQEIGCDPAEIKNDPDTGKPVYWVVCDYEYQ